MSPRAERSAGKVTLTPDRPRRHPARQVEALVRDDTVPHSRRQSGQHHLRSVRFIARRDRSQLGAELRQYDGPWSFHTCRCAFSRRRWRRRLWRIPRSAPPVLTDTVVSAYGIAPRGWLTQNGRPLAALLWLLGSAGFFGWTVVRTVRFQRTLTRAARPAPQLQRLAAEIGHTLGLPRVPRVYTTGARLRPLVWWAGGSVRILIPSVFVAELDAKELRAVLAHELAHVRRRDYLVRVVELLACSAYWWNPVVWWAKRKMRSAEESSCDILAVSATRLTRDRYAESLLRVVEIMSAVPVPRAPALASAADSCLDSRRLEKRLRTVLATPPVSPTPGRLRVAGAAALTCGLSLGLVHCTPGERLAFDQPLLPTPAMSEDCTGIRFVEYAGAPDIQAPFGLSTDPRYRHGNSPGDYRFRHI